MRALRDFNKPKITMDDRFIFLRLIEDLFPAIKADQKLDPVLEAAAKKVSKIRNEATNWAFQDEESFILKVVQMKEILDVRHCMFIIGEAGSAKTTIWTILIEALRELGQVTYFETLNPKAVSSDELFGYINKAGEWKDGVLSVIMRNQVRDLPPYTNKQKNKWTILDGDIDPEWIESLNTVMDDNKVLTLVSNERIPLTPEMRLIFEIANMKNATPATVSRGGVLFINLTDIGWRPYMESYIYSLKPEKANDQKEIKLIENATSVF
jgi:dynein heavy chain